jgi:tryptophan halogenase
MKTIKSVIILGGGSSGWMTAAALSKIHTNLKITLIESKNTGIIGVGESTLAQFNRFLQLLELKDQDWMPKCNAVYKTAIKFSRFLDDKSEFYDILKDPVCPIKKFSYLDFLILTKFDTEFKTTDFAKFFDETYPMIIQNKMFDNRDGVLDWNFHMDKAYHLDAYKFGETLRDLVALPNGVLHIVDDVLSSPLDATGNIDYLQTVSHGNLSADLYVDCTGFKGQLIGQTLGTEFESFSNVLINDSAVIGNISYENKEEELNSWTNCTTLENGWLWNIPVWDRIGTGYVYSSKFVDRDTAVEQYRNGLRQTFGSRANTVEVKHIKFNPGIRKTPWNKNVVSIGLSCGFIEPLRSTGLLFTHNSIIRLIDMLSIKEYNINQLDRDIFNKNTRKEITSFRDFVSSNYSMSRRADTDYWKYVTNNIEYTNDSDFYDVLSNVIHYGSANDPSLSIRILTGLNYNPVTQNFINKVGPIDTNGLIKAKEDWKKRREFVESYIKTLPSHYKFLKETIYAN